MNFTENLINVLVLFIGLSSAFVLIYTLVKKDLHRYFNLKAFELNKENRAHLLPLRLQAHERLILFVDRINPANLLVRVHQKGINVSALQATILAEISTEYQHNVTQQLYVDSDTWEVVKKLKLDTVAMIGNAAQGVTGDTNGVELSKAILQHMASIEQNPYDLTIELIKRDIHKMF